MTYQITLDSILLSFEAHPGLVVKTLAGCHVPAEW